MSHHSLTLSTSVSRSYTCSFFFNYTDTPVFYTLSLHALFRSRSRRSRRRSASPPAGPRLGRSGNPGPRGRPACCSSRRRSEEHTSELQSPCNLVCRLLLEKKKIMSEEQKDEDSYSELQTISIQ